MSLQHELKKRLPFDVPEQEVSLNLMRTADALQRDFSRLFKTHGISSAQYNVLRILRGAAGDGLPSLEIADRMITRVPDVTRLVDRLEHAALVQRARVAGDRRVVLVQITPRGLDLLARLDDAVMQLHRRQLQHLAPDELAELNRLLVKAREPADSSASPETTPQRIQGEPSSEQRQSAPSAPDNDHSPTSKL